jgi:dipeptidase D
MDGLKRAGLMLCVMELIWGAFLPAVLADAITHNRQKRCASIQSFLEWHRQTYPAQIPASMDSWTPASEASLGQRPYLEMAARSYVEHCALQETIDLTRHLVGFQTVSAYHPPVKGGPFDDMASFLRAWATEKHLGFQKIGQHDAWEVVLKGRTSRRHLAFVTHSDVVPAGEHNDNVHTTPAGWTRPPFKAEIVNHAQGKRLYGRGTQDDKGPMAASLVVLAALREFGLRSAGSIYALIGNAEESDWDGMQRYAQTQAPARFIISLDASYPLVVAQSGFVQWELEFLRGKDDKGKMPGRRLHFVDGGQFLTQVPGEAYFWISSSESKSELKKAVEQAFEDERKTSSGISTGYTYLVKDAPTQGQLEVRVRGVAAHSSTAEQAKNALWPLSRIAAKLGVLSSAESKALTFIAEYMADDHYGKRLGLFYEHPFMGNLLVVPTMLKSDDAKVRLSVNMRRPAGVSKEDFLTRLERCLIQVNKKGFGPVQENRNKRYVGDAMLADTQGKLVSTLLKIYAHHSQAQNVQAKAIRGGTYAKLFKGAVDFGPSWPGKPYRGHAPDEYIELDELQLMLEMILEATFRLDISM